LCLLFKAPDIIFVVVFFAAFIGTIFVLLGNDEDNDQFTKL
jgi:hypothetical protein